jgi:hypothetical protein
MAPSTPSGCRARQATARVRAAFSSVVPEIEEDGNELANGLVNLRRPIVAKLMER